MSSSPPPARGRAPLSPQVAAAHSHAHAQAVALASAAHAAAHAQQLSTSSRSAHGDGADGDDDNEGEEVFSNPDTAELEALSDGTGATSPGPNSPGPSSPLQRPALPHGTGPHGTLKELPVLSTSGVPVPFGVGSAVAQPSVETFRTARAPTNNRQPIRAPLLRGNSTGNVIGAPASPVSAISTSSSAAGLSLGTLPSAHGLPADPREATTLSTLFTHPPAQSPAEEIGQPVFALRSMPTTRPTSPSKSPARLGMGSSTLQGSDSQRVASGRYAHAQEESIFERDIEHRDANHSFTKAEAIEVAIPPVLDDAVEAIREGDNIEIVAPQSAPAPTALSTQALSAHTQSPLGGASVGADVGPPGTLAAQLAERFGLDGMSHPASSAGAPSANASPVISRRHRRPLSDASSSSSAGPFSNAASAGMQQVLESGTTSPLPPLGSTLFGTSQVRSTSRGNALPSPPAAASSLSVAGAGGASPLPGVSMPDPFRTSSPASTLAPLPNLPASSASEVLPSSSLSMDGAVIASSDVATADGSLGAFADALGKSTSASPYVRGVSASPRFGSPAMERSKSASGAPGMPGALPDVSTPPVPSSTTKRLSFFSYSDILNHTPGQLLDFKGAVKASAETDADAHAIGLGLGSGQGLDLHSPRIGASGSATPAHPRLSSDFSVLSKRTDAMNLSADISRKQ
ncbi:hypothetical protein CBOM_04782 [Ceraceosorus bombacis]|uniref:Uncharacterized protein n=1 Tax=Ceraceosorus bombacis TaxID=401625 RepID=A0A0P1BR92_9BASI|nr:hypothetical protein CBOM_04782 [Ceraceosorus bombacis]